MKDSLTFLLNWTKQIFQLASRRRCLSIYLAHVQCGTIRHNLAAVSIEVIPAEKVVHLGHLAYPTANGMIREETWPQIIHLILNDTRSGLFSARWRVRRADIMDSWQMFVKFDVEKIPDCNPTRSIGGYLCGGRQ
jgi:hypothetical protein